MHPIFYSFDQVNIVRNQWLEQTDDAKRINLISVTSKSSLENRLKKNNNATIISNMMKRLI
jgi:hypothetical protein